MNEHLDAMKKLFDMCGATLVEMTHAFKGRDSIPPADAQYFDQITHAAKSLKCVIAMLEEEDGGDSQRGSYRTVNTTDGARSYRGSMADGMSERGSMRSYRGGGMSGKRDSMGRYSRAVDELTEHLEQAMDASPDQHYRQKIEQLLAEING